MIVKLLTKFSEANQCQLPWWVKYWVIATIVAIALWITTVALWLSILFKTSLH